MPTERIRNTANAWDTFFVVKVSSVKLFNEDSISTTAISHSTLSSLTSTRTLRPGPGMGGGGKKHVVWRPSSRPILRTSSLNSSRRGPTRPISIIRKTTNVVVRFDYVCLPVLDAADSITSADSTLSLLSILQFQDSSSKISTNTWLMILRFASGSACLQSVKETFSASTLHDVKAELIPNTSHNLLASFNEEGRYQQQHTC